jgi:hypothetical protein
MAISNYYRSDGWVKTTLGPAVAGAQVWVCTQPANEVLPPSPLALIYSDNGLTPIVQPIITDGFGHYDFYVLPGLYTVIIAYNGVLQQVYPDQSIGGVGTSGSTSLSLLTNGTPNFNQLVQNLQQGAGILVSTDNFGNTTITNDNPVGTTLETNGTINPVQSKQNLVQGPGIVISADDAGDTTITNIGLPQPNYALYSMWQAAGTTSFGTEGFYATNDTLTTGGFGTVSGVAPTATTGPAVSFNAGYYFGNTVMVWPGRNLHFKTVATVNVFGGSPVYWGISNNATFGAGDPTTDSSAYSIVVGFVPPFANWQLISSQAGSPTYSDSGIPITLNQRYHLDITVASGVATLYVNNVATATLTTYPTTTPMALVWFGHNVAGPLGQFTTEFLYVDNEVL